MKVTRAALPFLPLCQRLLPSRLAGLSLALLKATALEIAILAGHLLLYPSGVTQERRGPSAPLPSADGAAQLPTETKPPVVLLHGFIDNRSVFVLLRRSLAQHGRQQVESLNYSPLTCDIRTAAELLEELTRPAPGCRTHFVSFWSDLDHLMDPLETACVDHPDLMVQNVRVSGIGHLALPVHPAVASGIRQALDAERTGAEAAAHGAA